MLSILNCMYGLLDLTTRYFLDLGTSMNRHLELDTMYMLVEYKEQPYKLY